MKLNHFLIFAVSISLIACNGSGSGEKDVMSMTNDELFGKVMQVHDDAMARMGELNQIKRTMGAYLINVDSSESRFLEVSSKIKSLEMADEAMFEWMAGFRDPRGSMNTEDAKTALMEEFRKVEAVDSAINESISQAQRFLQTLE